MKLNEMLKPVSRTTLADEIFERFLALIISGELSPGEKLPSERELADKLGVGRSSVREALRALSMIGILEARPGEGTFVNKSPVGFILSPFILHEDITKENVLELLEARSVLEVKLAALATEQGSKEEKDLIRQCFDNMRSNNDFESSLAEDWRFHEAIAQAAHNSYLFQMFLMIRHLIQEWINRRSYDYTFDDIRPAFEEHREILNAIQTGDAKVTEKAMQKHLKKAANRLLNSLQV